MAGRRQSAAKQTQDAAQGSSRGVREKSRKPVRKVIDEKSGAETDSSSETDIGSECEEVESWWTAGKKGKKSKKVSFVCSGGDVACGKTITSKVPSIQCEACGEWFHPVRGSAGVPLRQLLSMSCYGSALYARSA